MTRSDTGAGDAATPGMARVRMDGDLWRRLEASVKRADPDSTRSAVLRRFARWYVGDIDEFPQRPAVREDAA